MTQRYYVHPENPQLRLIKQVADIIRRGGVAIYPTDSSYAFACALGEKRALDRIKQIKQLPDKHLFTLMCRDLSEVADYAKVENEAYRLIKLLTPGAFTFVLQARNKVPRRLMHPTRKTIGFRVPGNNIAMTLLEEIGEPVLTTTLNLEDDDIPYNETDTIEDMYLNQVDAFIDGGICGSNETTMIDLTGGAPELIRQGVGDASSVGL
ncbi:MAG: threonylcarbamoyl-AMP synthase [Gammaproteobacteria bacterium]|nr:MAG: threonylcarbamoyl-AMP synthase [Gammaproteobacteria bacterium]